MIAQLAGTQEPILVSYTLPSPLRASVSHEWGQHLWSWLLAELWGVSEEMDVNVLTS